MRLITGLAIMAILNAGCMPAGRQSVHHRPHHTVAQNINALAVTSFLEARNGGWESIRAVQFSIINRAIKSHRDIYSTVHRRKHFSCFNKGDPNLKLSYHLDKLVGRDAIMWTQSKGLAKMIYYHRAGPDVTLGATHYAVAKLHPWWSKHMHRTVTIGGQKFYR